MGEKGIEREAILDYFTLKSKSNTYFSAFTKQLMLKLCKFCLVSQNFVYFNSF